MVKINFQNNITKCNADTFNTMQDNIENAINDASNTLDAKIDRNATYSTTETIVGTWTDGKPIYRKVFTGTITSISNFNLGSIGTFSTIVSISGYTNVNGYITSLLQYWSNTLKSILQVQASTGDLYLNAGSDFSNRPYTIIVEYTKAS